MTAFFIIGLGCSTEPPLPLPEPEQMLWQPKGRMVAATDLRGFLVMPQSTPAPGVLVLVDVIDDAEREAALALAGAGEVVLLLPPQTLQERGEQYLNDLPSTRGLHTLCKRARCP